MPASDDARPERREVLYALLVVAPPSASAGREPGRMSLYHPREEIDGVILVQDPYEVDALDREEGAGRIPLERGN